MAMVGVDSGSIYRRTHSPSRLAWSEGRRPLGAVLHSSNEPGELSQWFCHDDSTINIGIYILYSSLFTENGRNLRIIQLYIIININNNNIIICTINAHAAARFLGHVRH